MGREAGWEWVRSEEERKVWAACKCPLGILDLRAETVVRWLLVGDTVRGHLRKHSRKASCGRYEELTR